MDHRGPKYYRCLEEIQKEREAMELNKLRGLDKASSAPEFTGTRPERRRKLAEWRKTNRQT